VGIKKKGVFRKGEALPGAGGGPKGLAVVAVCPRRNKGVLFKFLNSGNFLTLTVLNLLNFAGEDGY